MAVWSTGTISEIGVVCIIVFELLLTKLAIAQPENKCYSRFSNLKSASLFATVLESPFIPPLKRRLDAGDFLSLNSLAEAGQPFVTALLAEISHRPILVVTAGLKSQEAFFNDLQTFIPAARFYPAWETLPHEDQLPHAATIADRLKVLAEVIAPGSSPGQTRGELRPSVLVCSVQALMQRTFAPEQFSALRFPLAVGQRLDLQEFSDRLVALGYQPEFQVTARGELAVRGGIVDFFPLDRDGPVRVELAGDAIESIRSFDPGSQQTTAKLEALDVSPAGELGLLKQTGAPVVPLVDLVPPNTLLVLVEPENLLLAADQYARQIPAGDRFFVPWQHTLANPRACVHLTEAIALDPPPGYFNLRLASLDAFRPLDARAPVPELAETMRRQFFGQMERWVVEDFRLQVLCSTDGERQRFEELWQEFTQSSGRRSPARRDPKTPADSVAPKSRPPMAVLGYLSRGFIWPEAKVAVVTDSEIFGRYKPARPRQKLHAAAVPIADWSEIEAGDYVVHLQHGIGKYLGLKTIAMNVGAAVVRRPGQGVTAPVVPQTSRQEVLAIEYANEARLYVPVDQAHLVSKYIGAGKRVPKLHEIGGTLWQRQKFSAERSIMDLASELLEIHAARATLEGHAFPPDTPWQREFEAAFPYDETPDQLTSIAEMKTDMEAKKPMDRLICGDVGYGKTEVAIRAAFKAVMDGMQVAVLCPTTVLAEQHWNTFRERMAGYPIKVEMLSRFRTPAESRAVVQLLGEGGVDIVIGTHRLLSADVQFKNLGLVVIDEEQRFGVLHKEKFKQLRKLVDVITLSATPIPRTLYMALTGARDMSTIETPPVDRLPVETIIAPYDERLIKQAIQREINRGGQIYFLHNRVKSIDAVADRLRQLFDAEEFRVPHADSRKIRIDVGHGQMSDDELETVMHQFVRGHTDVLVCTTIIESGLDIPNANTIIIDRADRFGLADLYQLRGRVGRYKHQAYAYILIPRHLQLIQTARKRISAIKQYSSLGSGFKIAMRDLEIRGAGNILGAEQSGHITAIGFDLYCQLLKESVGRLKGEQPQQLISVTMKLDFLAVRQSGRGALRADEPATELTSDSLARIPATYIQENRLRIQAYRKIAGATTAEQVEELRREFRDRYGKLPREVRLLLQCAEIKILAAHGLVEGVETKADKIMLSQRGQPFQVGGKFPRFTQVRPEDKLTELRKLLESLHEPDRNSI